MQITKLVNKVFKGTPNPHLEAGGIHRRDKENNEYGRECREGLVKRRLPWIQFPAIRAQSISKSPLHWCKYISSIAMHYNAHSALAHASHYVRSSNCSIVWHRLVHCARNVFQFNRSTCIALHNLEKI